MNGYERIMTAMALEQPDRVPIAEFLIDPKVYRALLPAATFQSDFEEHFDFDAVGCGAKFAVTRKNTDGSYYDEWDVLYKPSSELVDHPVKGPITSLEDIDRYTPPDPDAPQRLGRLPELVKKFKGKRAIVFHQRAAFMWSAYLAGIENLLADFLVEPEFAHKLLDVALEANIKLARNALRAGADIITLGDDYANNTGPLFSPAIFKEFILPRLAKIVGIIHEEKGKVIKHTDGNIWQIIDPIVATGIDGLNPIEPLAGMDIGEVKAKHGDQVCLLGNIDCGHLLPFGSPEEVEAAVKECIAKASAGGGHVLMSSNSIHSSVNPQNYLAMIQAARKYGRYPMASG
jgi:uroporphyrinogen decarboxylase